MDNTILDRLRKLRESAEELSHKHKEDLESFLHQKDKCTFRRLPEKESERGDVNITTTCSCLMSLVSSDKLEDLYHKDYLITVKKVLNLIMENEWMSSGLDESNAFSSSIVFRTIGFLIENKLVDPKIIFTLKHDFQNKGEMLLINIIRFFAQSPSENMKVNIFPPNATIVYWFVDGVDRASIKLSKKYWDKIFTWASQEFFDQLSRVSSGHEAMMDPISMAMAASLNARLHRIAGRPSAIVDPSLMTKLPSRIEIFHSIRILFDFQRPSGIWPKYFPIFNYKSEDAGSNYCFAFEMLEAILNELGTDLFEEKNKSIIEGFENAVQWCHDNRLNYNYKNESKKQEYTGWSSGGLIRDLKAGRPESWATAVVHVFLIKLQEVLSEKIQEHILLTYNATKFEKNKKEWHDFINIRIPLKQDDKKRVSLKKILEEKIISEVNEKGPEDLRKQKMTNKLSVLLFGPPGTSKTTLAKALAQKIDWPLIEINPSHFLNEGIVNIYSRADNVFKDLMELSAVVVLFDEMDALVRTRKEDKDNPFDITSRFLTTSMLPKLANLHDQGRVIFLMATNYPEKFDEAIKRPGRFDMQICMWPPLWNEKLNKLNLFIKTKDTKELEQCKITLKKYTDTLDIKTLLSRFTFTETKAFFEEICKSDKPNDDLKQYGKNRLIKQIENWSKIITLRDIKKKDVREGTPFEIYNQQREHSQIH